MKLIYCPGCEDIVRLFETERFCRCGSSWGWYTDDLKTAYAVYGGKAIPMGIDTDKLARALRVRTADVAPGLVKSIPFDAFLISADCDTFSCVESKPEEQPK